MVPVFVPARSSVAEPVSAVTLSTRDGALTVIWHVAVQLPAEAVIVTEPALVATTMPFFTLAMFGSLLAQETRSSGAFAGCMAAVSVSESPICSSALSLSSLRLLTSMASFVTVTVQSAERLPALTVILALPSVTPVTTPSFTVATAALLLDQVSVSSVSSWPLASSTVALSVRVSCGAISAFSWSSVTEPTPDLPP